MPANCIGTAFFAYYYPFRDAWDTAYEHIGDVSVHVLPGCHGPIATPAHEAIGEGVTFARAAMAALHLSEARGEKPPAFAPDASDLPERVAALQTAPTAQKNKDF